MSDSKLFVPHGTPIADSAARALEAMLSAVPPDTAKANVSISDGGNAWRVTTAVRVDGDNWALGLGGFVEKRDDAMEAGAGVTVSWK